jgi:hypothetical protein
MWPSDFSSKRVAFDARLAGVSSWGKARVVSLEAGLSVGGVCMLGCGKGNGEGRQGTQDIEKDNGLKKEERCRCTGTPTLELPSVFSGPVACSLHVVRVRCI